MPATARLLEGEGPAFRSAPESSALSLCKRDFPPPLRGQPPPRPRSSEWGSSRGEEVAHGAGPWGLLSARKLRQHGGGSPGPSVLVNGACRWPSRGCRDEAQADDGRGFSSPRRSPGGRPPWQIAAGPRASRAAGCGCHWVEGSESVAPAWPHSPHRRQGSFARHKGVPSSPFPRAPSPQRQDWKEPSPVPVTGQISLTG